MILKIKLYPFMFLLFSCNNQFPSEPEISLKDYSIYVKANADADAPLPPSYKLVFNFKNSSKEVIIFTAREHQYSSTKSRLYLLDTLQNKIVPIYSGSRNIVNSNDSTLVYADIDIRNNRKYFKLEDTFFNQVDYIKNKSLLDKLIVDMFNSSIIIYEQDTSDIRPLKYFNKNIKPLQKDKIIKIKKNHLAYKK